jgi:hypothetical protein
MQSHTEQVHALATILMDPTATLTEKDDAAIDLGEFDEPDALTALMAATQSDHLDSTILASIGESMAQIWVRLDNFDLNLFNQLPKEAQREAYSLIEANRPQWLNYLVSWKDEAVPKSKIAVIITSTEKEQLVAKLWYDNEQWAELSQEHGELQLEIYPKASGQAWKVRYADMIEAIQEAKERLLPYHKYHHEHRVATA